MDDEILKTVESMLGKDVKIVDCQKNTSVREEEILLINGIPVTLEGDDGDAIKTALMTGQVPPCDLLNQLLYQAGILRQPVQLETSLSVKSSTLTKEEITVAREGVILDERTSETKEDNYYTSQCKEIWQPLSSVNDIAKCIPIKSDSIPEDDKNESSSIKPSNSNIKNKSIPPKNLLSSTADSFTSATTVGQDTTTSFPTDSSISNSVTTSSSIVSNLSTDCPVSGNNNNNGGGAERKRTGVKGKKLLSNYSSDILNCKTFEKNSSLSCDSGHDGIFNSLSQTNLLQTANTENSISSCYDFISSDEADFCKASAFSPDFNKHSVLTTTSVFGTAPSDKFPKENVNRKGLPQTTATCIPKGDDKFISSSSSLNQESQKEILETDDNALVYRDGNLISGSLETLIQHMVPTSDYYPDKSYIFAFLLSARLFIRPYELLAKICQLCDEQQNFSSKSELQEATAASAVTAASSVVNALPIRPERQNNKSDERLQKFARHLVQLLAEWIGTFPYDFRDERVMQHVRSMTRKCINIDNELKKDVSNILQDLLHRLTVLEKYEEFLQSLARYSNDCFESQCLLGIGSNIAYGNASGSIASDPSSNHHQPQNYQQSQQQHSQQSAATAFPTSQINSAATSSSSLNSTSSVDISEMCSSPNLLASQLTHIELERLSHIGPEEFVQAFAKENSNFEQSFNDIKRTRNLESYVQWFNRLSYLVATEIVKHAKKKQRVKIVEYWIETARECFNIGNFNSLMAIIAGLNMSPISRLKKTWAKVQSAKFAVLEHQMDPSSNFNSYRSTLKAAMWRSAGATDERERIVIPFFSLLVKDLYFLNEGCSNKLPNGHINFEKFWQLAKQVTEFIAWKQVTCPFEKLSKVIMFLQTNNVFNENTLAMASFDCEPPENHEKDRYKCLKSEQQQQQQQQNTTHQ